MNRFLLVFEGVGMALESIRSNKVRAALTIAGVAIATLLHATVAAGLVTAGYWVAELVARSLWLRLAVVTVLVVGAVVIFLAALLA